MFWGLSDAREVLEWHGEFMAAASEDLYGFFAFLRAQPGDPFPVHLHGKRFVASYGAIPALPNVPMLLSNPSAHFANRFWNWSGRCPIQRCKACLTLWFLQVCSGIGKGIS